MKTIVERRSHSQVDPRLKEIGRGPWVYVMKARGVPYVKIGVTRQLHKRLETANTYSPWQLNYLCVVPGNSEDEAATHSQWKPRRMNGEWFHISPSLDFACSIARRFHRDVNEIAANNFPSRSYDIGFENASMFMQSIAKFSQSVEYDIQDAVAYLACDPNITHGNQPVFRNGSARDMLTLRSVNVLVDYFGRDNITIHRLGNMLVAWCESSQMIYSACSLAKRLK